MPEEDYWQSFFDADGVVETLFDAAGVAGDLVEFGCGYGTFTLPAARCTRGVVTALDIEPLMVARVRQEAEAQALHNVRAEIRDFVSQGTGLVSATQSHAMIFNLLHLEQPLALLREAHRTLHCGGTVAVMHWRSDVPTPRGPSLDIRPRPEQCQAWLYAVGFTDIRQVDVQAFSPYHFALLATR
ncbi:MAG: class I SAM-dependent methyltransferase [Pseudomonadaceae bacterium]|nr:class I SAM-dependent methyltransferase [Pseudomonadaceae bacterium]